MQPQGLFVFVLDVIVIVIVIEVIDIEVIDIDTLTVGPGTTRCRNAFGFRRVVAALFILFLG